MSTKSITLSSAGLRNIIKGEKEFTFIFGNNKIRLNNILAEFISPIVSHMHYSDPTIDSLCINYSIKSESSLLKNLFTEDIISFFHDISNGMSIEVNEEQATKIQLLSILLGNEELFQQSNQVYKKIDISNIDYFIEILLVFNSLTDTKNPFNFQYSFIIELISSNFNLIDKNKLLKLPRPIILSIITNEKMKLESEDSLLDFILQMENDDDDSIPIVTFLEKINVKKLSEEKFREFIQNLNPSEMTNSLWSNLCRKFLETDSSSDSTQNRYEKPSGKPVLFDGNQQNKFNGIIRLLTKECGGNVHKKGVVKVTESSTYAYDVKALNLVDLDNFTTRFLSENKENSWVQYDFIDKKVRPTHYSIRSRPYSKGENHLKGWVIEGSNTGANDWKILDSRSGVTCLDDKSASITFKIQNKLTNDDFYRYIRIRQTERSADNSNYMGLSALEFFGYIK